MNLNLVSDLVNMSPRATISLVDHFYDTIVVGHANNSALGIPSTQGRHSSHEIVYVEALIGHVKALSCLIDAHLGLLTQLFSYILIDHLCESLLDELKSLITLEHACLIGQSCSEEL